MINANREAEIKSILSEKGVTQPCPRCQNREFEIFAEAESPLVANRLDRLSPSFSTPLSVILLACKNCGYLAQHARALLGIIG